MEIRVYRAALLASTTFTSMLQPHGPWPDLRRIPDGPGRWSHESDDDDDDDNDDCYYPYDRYGNLLPEDEL